MVTDLLGNEDKEIVLAEKIMHRGSLYGMLQSGGKFPLEQLFGIKITPGANNFVNIQLITKGKKEPIRFKKEVRAKVIHVKGTTSNEVKDAAQKELAEESMF